MSGAPKDEVVRRNSSGTRRRGDVARAEEFASIYCRVSSARSVGATLQSQQRARNRRIVCRDSKQIDECWRSLIAVRLGDHDWRVSAPSRVDRSSLD